MELIASGFLQCTINRLCSRSSVVLPYKYSIMITRLLGFQPLSAISPCFVLVKHPSRTPRQWILHPFPTLQTDFKLGSAWKLNSEQKRLPQSHWHVIYILFKWTRPGPILIPLGMKTESTWWGSFIREPHLVFSASNKPAIFFKINVEILVQTFINKLIHATWCFLYLYLIYNNIIWVYLYTA